jgi:hypothetical protein
MGCGEEGFDLPKGSIQDDPPDRGVDYYRHGGPYDRGRADAYYWRPARPHYFVGGTYLSPEVNNLTVEEIAAYMAGYTSEKDRKNYGDDDSQPRWFENEPEDGEEA